MVTLPRRRSASRLSLTPLIDVVFILLIFFMLESDFLRPYVIELPPPGGSARSADAKSTPLLIELHSDQTIWINKGNYAMADVEQTLYALNLAPDSPVVLASDPGVGLAACCNRHRHSASPGVDEYRAYRSRAVRLNGLA